MKWLSSIKPVFSVKQLERLSNIFDNAGQVVFGVVVLSPIISGLDNINWFMVLSGIVGIILCWALSLWFVKKGENI